ncbi:proton-conducting transporter membrane subunit [Fodinicurvata sp. EGI_FJ10296]|uniref:complex I subunit 5 family protein n=1 Tax=Fodinicurvata sp. EGI_FJ10296 TaxID=3231908 RepID=UPI003453042F
MAEAILSQALPLVLIACSLLPAVAVFLLSDAHSRARSIWTMAGATAKLIVLAIAMIGVQQGRLFAVELPIGPGMALSFRIDALALLFVSLSAVLWFVTTIYALAYLAGTPDQRRFFGFFNLCVASTSGIALAGTPLTFFVFYELLTLSTYPLVVHGGDRAALAAGRRYLRYTMAGSAAFLIGAVWLESMAGELSFGQAGQLAAHVLDDRAALTACFVLLVGGLAVKAAMMPFHGWLPNAMVAPAPVSALLHAVAVVKAGAFGILRVVLDLYGIELTTALGVALPLAIAASVTILGASMIALAQRGLKRRLAYSTVSQVSYIVLGVAMLGPVALAGGLVHLVHQGLMKITLFFCAGTLQKTLGIHEIDEMAGVGWRMPATMLAFSAGALGMVGTPPLAGFVSKWYLGIGAIESGQYWVVAVLAASSLLNAAYFLPILYAVWFRPPVHPWPDRDPGLAWRGAVWEAKPALVIPAVFTAAAAVGAGLFAAFAASPLQWAILIVEREYTLL